jgi:hypothetical protein
VDVDPLSGKVLVTQTDAITIFDGLAVDSKPAVNAGASEKGKLWGDLRSEQNDTNAYVTAPAVDQRQVNEMVRGLASDLPQGADLSKAKAWCIMQGTGTAAILSSFNIKSITDGGTGTYTFTYGIPFKSDDAYAVTFEVLAQSNGTTMGSNPGTDRFGAKVYTYTPASDPLTQVDAAKVIMVAYGELENE